VGVALLAGCGGSDVDANDVLSQTATNLPKLKSAQSLHLKLLVEPREDEPFGFEIEGPFSLCDHRPLPRMNVVYTQIANGQEGSVRLLSTGEQGYVELGGTTYELTDRQEADLRSACGELGGGEGLGRLEVGDWVRDPDGSRDGDVDRVTGELDVVAVVNDLVDVARAFGGSQLQRLDRDDAERIAEATDESEFELESGHEDRLLRALRLSAELGLEVPDDLRRALGDVVGATFTFELELDEPNTVVEVGRPANARPSSEQPGGRG
jgi:hypothetical protein